ncbi:MAG: secretion system protein E [Methanophagales archaeon ANME-1-THS]|nr:MAG: secretion system protein E [Methanophagales archaeon ANME-1-THS]
MPTTRLPFESIKLDGTEANEDHGMTQCALFQLLPPEERKYIEESKHVFKYLHMMPLDTLGVPKFYPQLTRKMKEITNPNLIYPVNADIAVHICYDKEDARHHYIPIEPFVFQDFDALVDQVAKKISVLVDQYEEPKNAEQKKAILESCIDAVCELKTEPRGGTSKKKLLALTKFWKDNGDGKKIAVNPFEFKAVKYLIIRDNVGLGVLDPLIHDPHIEDISCSGLGNIFIEHKIFESCKAPIRFEREDDLDAFVIKLSEKIGKPVSYFNPIMDATLPDGSRINIVLGKDISKQGSNFTIRKFSQTPLSVLQLIEYGTLDYIMAAYFWIALREGMNCFIAGETASGKTTTMNAITTFIPPKAKIVSIEETSELQVPHQNWIREVTRTMQGKREGEGSRVEMFDLLRAALRQRPNEIIVGEIRGVEGNIVFQGMQTGHPAMSTFHASTVEKLIQRITGDPINVPKTYIDNLNVVVFPDAVRGPDGRMLRRITSVNEIVGYDTYTDSFSFIEVFRWNPSTDTFQFTGNMNSYLLERKIAPRKGIPEGQERKIYKELEKRARILKKIHESGITDFYELFSVLAKMEGEAVA